MSAGVIAAWHRRSRAARRRLLQHVALGHVEESGTGPVPWSVRGHRGAEGSVHSSPTGAPTRVAPAPGSCTRKVEPPPGVGV